MPDKRPINGFETCFCFLKITKKLELCFRVTHNS